MKVITTILTLLFALSIPAISHAQCPQSGCDIHHYQSHNNCSHANKRHHHHNSDYMVSDFKVYYRGKAVEGATASSFTILDEGYAKDALPCSVKDMPRMPSGCSTKDKRWKEPPHPASPCSVKDTPRMPSGCSTEDKRWKVVSSFTLLGKGYAKDTFNVFYRGQKMEGATSSSFVILDNGYAKDAFNTYYNGRKI